MFLRTIAECEAAIPVGEAYRMVFRECTQTVAAGGIYRYEPGVLSFFGADTGGLFFVAAIALLAILIAVINTVTGNEGLTGKQKWGYALGIILFPVVFIPLYLILAPDAKTEQPAPQAEKA